jgi:hypothetical protein
MKPSYSEMTLAELAHSRAVLQDYLLRAVIDARRGGSTWAAIGSSLGVSGSEAHRRYHWTEKLSQAPDTPAEGR